MASDCDAVPVGPAASSGALDDRGGSSSRGFSIMKLHLWWKCGRLGCGTLAVPAELG